MNLYLYLSSKPIFNMNDVNKFYNNIDSARSAVKRLLKQKLVLKIRNNLYTCANGMGPLANRFQVASAITDTSYVSYHTAMEYYGTYNQVYYEVYVSSDTKFNNFEFDGYRYIYVPSKLNIGIINQSNNNIKITDLERSIVDCIKNMDKISGIEEIISIIEDSPILNEEKIAIYLEEYNNKFLYQKAGFLLENIYSTSNLSKEFFESCLSHIGKSCRYLTSDYKKGTFNKKWNLIIPDPIYYSKNGELPNEII